MATNNSYVHLITFKSRSRVDSAFFSTFHLWTYYPYSVFAYVVRSSLESEPI